MCLACIQLPRQSMRQFVRCVIFRELGSFSTGYRCWYSSLLTAAVGCFHNLVMTRVLESLRNLKRLLVICFDLSVFHWQTWQGYKGGNNLRSSCLGGRCRTWKRPPTISAL